MGQSSNEYRLVCEKLAQWIERPPACAPAWPPDTWQRFIEGCRVHGVASLLYVRRDEMLSWPSHIMAWIDDQYAQNRRRIKRMIEDLSVILDIFERYGVRAMPLKGLVVTELAYENIALRPMNDLDLLLAQRDFEVGEGLLAELGYEKVFAGWKHTKFSKPGNRLIVDCDCEHPDNPRPVEIHSHCVEQIREERIDLTEQVWTTAKVGHLMGRPAWLMNSDVLWVYLLIHATHHILHNNFRLIQLIDLLRLRSVAEIPAGLLNSVDARATIAPLVLLQRYFPCRETEVLLRNQRERITASFAAWAESLDLYTVSYLNPAPWRD